jgi:reverse transcriptase-like protein/aspartyl protease
LDVFSVTVATIKSNSLSIPISINCARRNETVETLGLIDSGAGGQFIDQNYVKPIGLITQTLDTPITARNVDGTENKRGKITTFIDLNLTINKKTTKTRLLVTGLGKQKIILGFPWLNEQNPNIDWKTGRITWRTHPALERLLKELIRHPKHQGKPLGLLRAKALARLAIKDAQPKPIITETPDEEEKLNRTQCLSENNEILLGYLEEVQRPNEVWINAKTSNSIEFHLKHDRKEEELPLDQQVPKPYHAYLEVFNESKADRFPESRSWDHKIELKEGFEPKSFKTYNLTPEEQKELDQWIKENLEKGYICPLQSPMASPFFYVKKKDGKLRPCQDYRYLNDWTIKNAYPLPLISELTDKLAGAKYFTKLVVRWGYNNIRIKDGDQWKAAFKTNKGLYEPTVMFFGMCNSPATFQAMMDSIFGDLIEKCMVIIYMDDIFLFAKTPEELEDNTKRVLQRLQENDLFLKPKKCEFCKTKVEWLGMIIEEGKISMDPGKLKGISEWPNPETVKQTRGFLGFGNFYRRFIRHFSEIAKPLNDLLKKD